MSIVVGLQAKDGIVLGADSQETIGYTKDLSKGKVVIMAFPASEQPKRPIVTCTFAGAGWSDYIATANDKISDALGECSNLVQVQKALDKCLRKFHNERIAPWHSFPEQQQPNMELLIGVSIGKASALFHSQGTAFYWCKTHQAIGAGAILANSLLAEYCYGEIRGVNELIPLVAFILFKVKQNTSDCGGFSQIVPLRDDGDFALVDGLKEFEEKIHTLQTKSAASFAAKLIKASKPLKVKWLLDTMKEHTQKPSSSGEPSSGS